MKKFLLHILLFFAIVGVVDVGVGFCGRYLQGHAKGGSTRQFEDLVMNDKHDILILGSSRAHYHYDSPFLSDTLGVDVYNAGHDGNGVILADGIFNLVLNHYKPQIVIYDVEPSFDVIVNEQDNQNVRYINDLKSYYQENGIPKIIKGVSNKEWYKVQSGLIRYNTNILGMFVDNIIDRGIEKGGFAPLDGKMESEPVKNQLKPKEYVIDKLKLAYVEDLIDLCQANDVLLLIVASPKYGEKNTSIVEPIKQIAKKKGVCYLDYYDDPTFMSHKEWFKEPMHLNKEGARVFSKIIAERLVNEQLIN